MRCCVQKPLSATSRLPCCMGTTWCWAASIPPAGSCAARMSSSASGWLASSRSRWSKYCSLAIEPVPGQERIFHLTDMVEKPSLTEVLSNYSILGRVVLPPEIFSILEQTPPGAGGEIQLTDAMKVLAKTRGMMGVEYTGTRYDMGNKFGILQAIVEVALQHPQVKDQFREYLKSIAATL